MKIQDFLDRFAQVVNCETGAESNAQCNTNLPQVTADSAAVETILSIVFGTLTAVAILVIVIMGIRFILSSGDPDKAANARKGVIYALVGLIVVFAADIIVYVLLGRI